MSSGTYDSEGRVIDATPEAADALRRLTAEHGPLLFHVMDGAELAGSPVCLPVAEMSIGGSDRLLGTVEGVDVFRMARRPGVGLDAGQRYVLSLTDAFPAGFSLSPAPGKAFRLFEVPVDRRD